MSWKKIKFIFIVVLLLLVNKSYSNSPVNQIDNAWPLPNNVFIGEQDVGSNEFVRGDAIPILIKFVNPLSCDITSLNLTVVICVGQIPIEQLSVNCTPDTGFPIGVGQESTLIGNLTFGCSIPLSTELVIKFYATDQLTNPVFGFQYLAIISNWLNQ